MIVDILSPNRAWDTGSGGDGIALYGRSTMSSDVYVKVKMRAVDVQRFLRGFGKE